MDTFDSIKGGWDSTCDDEFVPIRIDTMPGA